MLFRPQCARRTWLGHKRRGRNRRRRFLGAICRVVHQPRQRERRQIRARRRTERKPRTMVLGITQHLEGRRSTRAARPWPARPLPRMVQRATRLPNTNRCRRGNISTVTTTPSAPPTAASFSGRSRQWLALQRKCRRRRLCVSPLSCNTIGFNREWTQEQYASIGAAEIKYLQTQEPTIALENATYKTHVPAGLSWNPKTLPTGRRQRLWRRHRAVGVTVFAGRVPSGKAPALAIPANILHPALRLPAARRARHRSVLNGYGRAHFSVSESARNGRMDAPSLAGRATR